jgi:hypothetical protein
LDEIAARRGTRTGRVLATGAAALLALTVLLHAAQLRTQMHPKVEPLCRCAEEFAARVPDGSLIIASGGEDIDAWGNRNAANAPYFFFWMDRKGFSLPDSRQNLTEIEALRRRGARYLVVERERIAHAPGFEEQLSRNYRQLAACERALLFELGPAE